MSASQLTVQVCSLAGLTPSYVAANVDGNFFPNSGKEFIHIKNAHTSPQTITINSQTNCNQGFDHDDAVVVTNAQERMIGPFPKDRFNDGSGYVQITYSGVTALTLAVVTVA